MKITHLLVFCWLVFCVVSLHANLRQDPTDRTAMKERIGELAKRLDADKESDRNAAEKELTELGPDVLEFLPPLDDQASPELRMRIERIHEKFFRETTLDFHEPAMVNLQGEMSLSEALLEIEKQTRNKIGTDSYKRQEAFREIVELDIQGVTYWEAIDEILEKIDWQIVPKDIARVSFGPKSHVPEDPNGPLKSLPRESIPPIYIGVLRMQPVSLSKMTNFLDPLQSNAQLDFVLHWEPRFTPVFVRFPMDKLVVRTENDEALLVPKDQSCEYVPTGSQLVASMKVLKPTQAAAKIASWKGELQIAIPGRITSVEFDQPKEQNGKSLHAGDLTVILEAARKNRDLQEIQIGVSLTNQPSNDVLQGWVALTDGFLVDKDGNQVEHAGWATTRLTKTDLGLSYLFDIENDLSEYRFVYRAPESVILQEVEYEFNNIPFP